MPVDTSIYGNLLRPAPSLMDNVNALDAADAQRTQLAGAKVNLIGQQQSLADQQAVRALYQRPGFDPSTPQGMSELSAASPTTALTTRKAILDNAKVQADTVRAQGLAPDQVATTAKTTSETAGLNYDQSVKRTNQHLQQLVSVGDVPGAVSWIGDAVKSGELPADQAQQVVAALQSGKIPLQDWKQKAMAGGLSLLDQRKTAQEAANAAETARHNQASEVDTRRGQDITAQTARTGQMMENKRAGYDANGNMVDLGTALGAPPVAAPAVGAIPKTPGGGPPAPVLPGAPAAAPASGPYSGIIDAVGQYKQDPHIALARVPLALRSQVDAAITAKYPDYDPSNFGARQKGAKDFGTGKQGDALRSFAVAGEHLDQLEKLADAIHNGDTLFVNKVANAYGIQTGQAPVAVFNAVKNIVGQEVVKSIVAGGGGEAERKDAANAFDPNSSPSQFKGTIGAVKHVMQAQQEGLLTQRRGLGLSDKTLPEYFKKAKPGDEAALHSAAEAILKGTK